MAILRSVAAALLLFALLAGAAGQVLPFLQGEAFADPDAPRDYATPWLLDAEQQAYWFEAVMNGAPSVDAVRGGAILLAVSVALQALAVGVAAGHRTDWALGLAVPATLLLGIGLTVLAWKLPEAAAMEGATRSAGFAFLAVSLALSFVATAILMVALRPLTRPREATRHRSTR